MHACACMRNIDSPSSYLSDSGAQKLNQTGGMLKNLKQVVVLQITAKVSDKYT